MNNDNTSAITLLQEEIEQKFQSRLIVPEKSIKPDKLIISFQDCFKEWKRGKLSPDYMVEYSRDSLDMKISMKYLERGLRFWDTLIKFLQYRGHKVVVEDRDTYIVVNDHKFKVLLRERTKREMYRENNRDQSRYIPTGSLYFQHHRFYPQKEWKEGKEKIEKQIANIVAYFEVRGEEERLERIESEKRKEKKKEEERLLKEFEEKQERELEVFKTVLQDSERWHKSVNLRNYITEVEAKAIAASNVTEELKAWIDWAKKKADWYDPFIGKEDDILNGIDKASLIIKKKNSFSW
jgi:hypothetical protein